MIPRRSRFTCNRLQILECGDYITIMPVLSCLVWFCTNRLVWWSGFRCDVDIWVSISYKLRIIKDWRTISSSYLNDPLFLCNVHFLWWAQWNDCLKVLSYLIYSNRLTKYDAVKQVGIITATEKNSSYQLTINTQFIEPFQSRLGSMFQFIGEMPSNVTSSEDMVVQARVVRCVDGIDVTMYYNACDVRRKFFESRNLGAASTPSWCSKKDVFRTSH